MLEKFDGRLFFLHIPKTGGVTLHEMLLDYFEPESVCPERHNAVILLPPNELKRYQFFSAHTAYDLVFRLPKPVHIVSIFREPVQRSLSGYYFLRRFPQSTPEQRGLPEPKLARFFSLLDYLNWDNRFFQEQLCNQHFSILCGHRHLNPSGMPWRGESEMLDVAYMRIESMDCFGITEFMPASVASIWRKLGLKPPSKFLQLNKGGSATGAEDEISSSILERLEEINQIDIKLYAFAKARFLADPLNRIFPLRGFYSKFLQTTEPTDSDARYLSAPGQRGYCLFGPYVQLGAGSYTCTFDISFVPSGSVREDEIIANIDVCAIDMLGAAVVFAGKNLTMGQVSDARIVGAILEFKLVKSQDALEFRIYVEGRGHLSAKAEVMISID